MKTQQLITVLGATGNIGTKLTRELLRRGVRVRAFARHSERLQELGKLGAEVVAGSIYDINAVEKVLQGADAAFVMIPPEYTAPNFRAAQNEVGKVIAAAIQKSGVAHIVNLSSIGAELGEGVGPIKGLHDQEMRLNALAGLSLVHLRPAYFFENVLFGLDLIKTQNIYGTAVRSDVAFPQIATQDIAVAAADHLLAEAVTGTRVAELLGPKDLSMDELVQTLKQSSGKEKLSYVAFDYESTRAAIAQSGLSADVADQFVELYTAINEKRIKSVAGRQKSSTTPTAFKDFARQVAAMI